MQAWQIATDPLDPRHDDGVWDEYVPSHAAGDAGSVLGEAGLGEELLEWYLGKSSRLAKFAIQVADGRLSG